MALVSPVGQTEVITIAEPAQGSAGITGQSLGILLPVLLIAFFLQGQLLRGATFGTVPR